MIRVRITCEGTSPLLMDRFLPEEASEGKELSRREQAAAKLYREGGRVGLPAVNFIHCLVSAGERKKLKGISYRQAITPFTIEEMFLPLEIGGDEWSVDTRRGRTPNGVTIKLVRPRFDRWAFTATFQIDEDKIGEEVVQKLVEYAGLWQGIGAFRPARHGSFGRFRISKWERIEG